MLRSDVWHDKAPGASQMRRRSRPNRRNSGFREFIINDVSRCGLVSGIIWSTRSTKSSAGIPRQVFRRTYCRTSNQRRSPRDDSIEGPLYSFIRRSLKSGTEYSARLCLSIIGTTRFRQIRLQASRQDGKYPAAEPGALVLEPLEAACPCRFISTALPR